MDTVLDLDQINQEIKLNEPIEEDYSYEDLLRFIDNEEAAEFSVDTEYRITSDSQANYYIRQYKELQKDLNKIEESKQEAIDNYTDKVSRWAESKSNPIKFKMDFYSGMLEQYAASKLEGSKSRSLKLIEGNIGFRKVQPSVERDDEALRNYLNGLGEVGEQFLIQQDPKIDWSNLKKSGEIRGTEFFYNGRPVPGVTVTQKPDAFGVK